jgi:serine/threonine-protein kinase
VPDRWLTDLATSIADGESVDWAAADARATEPADRDLLDQLKVVERITRGHEPGGDRRDLGALTTWGPFNGLTLIGHGTFGDVYRATDPRLDRLVALKLLRRREPGLSPEDRAVIEEARLMARVRHPHVVTVYGAERIDDRVGVWMEFIEGRTLEDDLRANGPFSVDDIVSIGIDLCGALAAVHRVGLLHRDVKAQNVIREASGRSVLTDFGSGRAVSLPPAPDPQTELAGTPLYLAPEVLAGAAASAQSEVYSLGVLLHHLATGSFPVRGRTLRDVRDLHDRRIRQSVRKKAPTLPAAVAGVIDRATAPDPAARYQSAEGVSAALQRVQARRRLVRRPALWAAVALAVTVLGAAEWAWLTPRNGMPAGVVAPAPDFRQLAAPWIDDVVVGNPEPNGQWLVCVEKRPDGTGRVARCDLSSRRNTAIGAIGEVAVSSGALVSADGARVAYVKPAPDRELRSSKIDGSDERLLRRFTPRELLCDLASWSWEGDTLAGVITSTDGTSEIVALAPDSPNGRRWPMSRRTIGRVSLSPDAQRIVFDADAYEPNRRDRDLFIIDLAAGTERRLARGPAVAPVWSTDGRSVFFATDRSGRWTIWRLAGDLDTEPVPTPVQELGTVGLVTVLGNRHDRVFYRLEGEPVEVHTASIDWEARRLDDTGPGVLAPISASSAPAWSPDGKRLAYLPFDGRQFAAAGRVSIIDALHGGQPASILITDQPFQDVTLLWAPNGQSLVACCALGASSRAWLLDVTSADGRRSHAVDFDLASPVFAVAFARDSNSMFYSTTNGIWSHDLKTNIEQQLFASAGQENLGNGLEVSPDGHRIAFDVRDASTHRTSIRSVPVGGGIANVVYESDQSVRLTGWSGDSSPAFVFLQSVTTSPPVWSLDKLSGALSLVDRKLITVPFPSGTVRQLRLHPDGRRVAYSTVVPAVRLWVLRPPA